MIRHAYDDFSRWDATQSLLRKYIYLCVKNYRNNREIIFPDCVLEAFRNVLISEKDPALAALMISVPSMVEIAEYFETIDPDAISTVRHSLLCHVANELNSELRLSYDNNRLDTEYSLRYHDIGRRSMRNISLSYLAFSNHKTVDKLVEKQYRDAGNMTDRLAALSASVMAQLNCRKDLMNLYKDSFYTDTLAMDKWLVLQATSPSPSVLEEVKDLLSQQVFDMNNPNRIHSLIGKFVSTNLPAFHSEDGSGYTFLVDILSRLNTSNPQISAYLIEPLLKFQRYDKKRQELMREALDRLQRSVILSNNLYDKICRALNSSQT